MSTKLGIIGGGQLARMLGMAALPLGIDCQSYDPDSKACAGKIAPIFQGSFDDSDALQEFAAQVDLLTYEFENVHLQTLAALDKSSPIYPQLASLEISQHRLREKKLFNHLEIRTNAFESVKNTTDLALAISNINLPLVIKSVSGGYDGKHQWVLKTQHDVDAWILHRQQENWRGQNPGWIAEGWINFQREVSMIGVRNVRGEMKFYDLCENVHRQGILSHTINKINDPLQADAEHYVAKLMQHLQHVGILTVEFFVCDGRLIANEMAPRVHNTGHWTIEAAHTSQFENHLRAIMNFPLGETASTTQSVIINCIGGHPDIKNILNYPNLHWHDYTKPARPGRKVAHMTYCDKNEISEVKIRELLKLQIFNV
ncbi:MAG: 5-(carboxyamino)imidazole ribonucleotide synthase [Pseudomonadota bacterium]